MEVVELTVSAIELCEVLAPRKIKRGQRVVIANERVEPRTLGHVKARDRSGITRKFDLTHGQAIDGLRNHNVRFLITIDASDVYT